VSREDLGNREQSASASAPSDEQARAWSTGISHGDRLALAHLFAARFDWMVDQCRVMTGKDEHFALDTVQDAMVRLARGMMPLTSAQALDRYLRAVLRSCALDRLRAEARRSKRERQSSLSINHSGNKDVRPSTTDSDALQQIIATLSAQEQDTLLNRVIRGIGLSALADMHGTTSSIMQGRVRRMLERLRSEVKL